MRILITGATGFIGRVLIPQLLTTHPDVQLLCVVRDKESARNKLPDTARIFFTEGLNRETIVEFSPKIVLHLAAFNTSSFDTAVIDRLIDSNIAFGVKLLDILSSCIELKLFVNTGSFSQYADGHRGAYLYSASKSAFEIFLDFYASRFGFKTITIVPYSVYGGDRTVKRIMDYIIESIDSVKPVEITEGLQQLDFIHVDDVVKAYIAVIDNYCMIPNREKLHIGTGQTHTLRDVAKIVEQITGKHCNIEWGTRPYRVDDIMYAKAPNMEYKFWEPTISLERGIALLVKDN